VDYLDSKDIIWARSAKRDSISRCSIAWSRRKRLSAVDPILDVAERTKDARMRERLLDVLLPLGDDIGAHLVRRIEGARAEMRRDLFLLLGKLKNIPQGFDARGSCCTRTARSDANGPTAAEVRRDAGTGIVAGVTDTGRTRGLLRIAGRAGKRLLARAP